MASYNKVILMGNLTRDPELRYTANNMAICKFGLAVNRRFKDGASGEWKEEPTFVDITIFGARAEPFAKYHSKGKPALDDKNGGGKRSKLYVVAENWEFVGGGGGKGGDRGGADAGSSAGGSQATGVEPGAPEREPEFQQVDDTPF